MNRFLKQIRGNNAGARKKVTGTARKTAQPAVIAIDTKPKSLTERFDDWMDKAPEIKIFGVIIVLYCIGSAFYAGIMHLGGYSFGETYQNFFLSLTTTFILFLYTGGYRHCVAEKSHIFGSHQSWFMRFGDFIENDWETFNLESDAKGRKRSRSQNLVMATLSLPLLGIAAGLIYSLLLVVLILDWLRLFSIGFANLCFFITPPSASLAYLLWTVIGFCGAFVPGDTVTHFFVSLTAAQIFGACVFLYKELREKKYNTPYFPA